MIGMLLNVGHGSGPKKLTKAYNNGFPNHSTLITEESKANYCKMQHTQEIRSKS